MKSFFGGFLSTCIIGLQRGIFSNEAGLGTGSIAASTTSSNNASSQSYLQVLGVYITSLLLCTATAIFILTTDYSIIIFEDINGIELMQYAFSCHVGSFGSILLFIFQFPESFIVAAILALSNLFPIFGPLFGFVVFVLLCLMMYPQFPFLLVILVFVFQQIESNWIQPLIFKKVMHLKPIVTLIRSAFDTL